METETDEQTREAGKEAAAEAPVPEPSTTLLKATELYLGYGRRMVLRSVYFEACRGQRWFIVGPNGQGKTTLLRGILGLIPSNNAELWRHPESMRPSRIGFVPQSCELNPTLPTSVREFVLLGLIGLKVRRAERKNRLRWALGRVDLEPLRDADYWSLSGGQRQRALLARALVRWPEVLLLDEPTNGLDLKAEEALMRSLAKLNEQEGLTFLFVTHDVELAARYATHVALVYGGSVHAGPVDQVLTDEALEQAYGVPIHVARESGGAVGFRVGEGGGSDD